MGIAYTCVAWVHFAVFPMIHFPSLFGRVLPHVCADVDVHDVVGTELNMQNDVRIKDRQEL